MLTQEKANNLTQYLNKDIELTRSLFEMEPEEALTVINNAGLDYTKDELVEYCEAVKKTVDQDELHEEDLDAVAGGIGVVTACVLIVGGAFLGGIGIGVAVNAKW